MSLDALTLDYWKVSQVYEGYNSKRMSVGKAITTLTDIYDSTSAYFPNSRLRHLANNLRYSIILPSTTNSAKVENV